MSQGEREKKNSKKKYSEKYRSIRNEEEEKKKQKKKNKMKQSYSKFSKSATVKKILPNLCPWLKKVSFHFPSSSSDPYFPTIP